MKQERNTFNMLFEPKTAVRLVLLFSTSVILARYIWTGFGGWITGDEAIYAWSMIRSVELNQNVHLVMSHMLFSTVNIQMAILLGLDNIFSILVFYLFQALLWNFVSVVALYYILEELPITEISKSLTLYSLPCLAVFTVMNSLFLTEAPGLAFSFVGILFLVKTVKNQSWKTMAIGTVGLCVSAMYREPFLMLIGIIGVMILYMTARKQISLKLLVVFCLIVFLLVPAPINYVKTSVTDTYNTVRETVVSSIISITNFFVSLTPINVLEIKPVTTSEDIYVNETDSEFIPYTYYYCDEVRDTLFEPTMPSLGYLLKMGTVFFMFGSGTGWSFVLFPVVILSIVLCIIKIWKNRGNNNPVDKMMLASTAGALLSHWILGILLVRSTYFENPTSYGTMFRFSYTTIPAVICLSYAYNYIQRKHLKYLLVVPVIMVLCALLVSPIIQSNQSVGAVNRINFGYKAPYYRVYTQLALTKTPALVYVDPAMRISLFMDGVQHVTLKQMIINKTRFDALFNEYRGEVYLYQEKWPLYRYVIEEHYFVIRDILAGTTEYEAVTVWETPEAYLYKVTQK